MARTKGRASISGSLKIRKFGEDENQHENGHLDYEYNFEAQDRELNEKINQANEKHEKLVKKTEKQFNATKIEFEKEVARMQKQLVEDKLDLKKDVDLVKDQIDASKDRVVETLAVFAALFTFLSLQVQVFKDETNPNKLLGLVLVSGGLITFFVLILDLMIKTKSETQNFLKTRFYLLFFSSVILIGVGVLLAKSS